MFLGALCMGNQMIQMTWDEEDTDRQRPLAHCVKSANGSIFPFHRRAPPDTCATPEKPSVGSGVILYVLFHSIHN